MDGPSLIQITLETIPKLIDKLLADAGLERDQIELFLMHQATFTMLEQLRERLDLPSERMPIVLENVGNTVSCTLPIVIDELRASGRLRPGTRTLQIGFGVGFSWAGCLWTETWAASQAGTHSRRAAA